MITKETMTDIIGGIRYAESQFKKVVDVTNQTSEKLTLNCSDNLADFCIMAYLAKIEGMIQIYKSHAFSCSDLVVYDQLLLKEYKSAEEAYKPKIVTVQEGVKA